MYQALAHLYDWPGALAFSDLILQKDHACFEKLGIGKEAHILDLACGTGTLALQLGKLGYTVTGMDIAVPMLEQARKKQAQQDLSTISTLAWKQGDMRDFYTDSIYDVVLCHYDSLNHLSNETELHNAFLHVSQALKPNGVFIFDLNTLENYQTFWNGKDTYEGPNYRLKTEASFNEESGKAEVHFLAHEYNDLGQLHQLEDTLYEQFFEALAVEKYLQAAGFMNIQYETFNANDDLPADFPLKTYWLAMKAG